MPVGRPCVYYPDFLILISNPPIASAADYNCRLPVNTSPVKIFTLTVIGVFIPSVFVNVLGALLMTVPAYVLAYKNGDAAGVMAKGAACLSWQPEKHIDAHLISV